MTFAIAIPVYNGEEFLEQALSSALSQRRPADEIVAVDDASTDRSAEILKAGKWAGKIRYIYNKTPTGYADAWNRVVAHTHADFVTILHQDDLLDPGYLYHIERALEMYPKSEHAYSGYRYIDEHGTISGESPLPHSAVPELLSGKEYAHRYLAGVIQNRHIHRCPGVTTGRKLLLEKCSYRKEAGVIADDDFFLRVGEFTDVVAISEPLASYRLHSRSAWRALKSLAGQLAVDYVFQVEQCRSRSSFLSQGDQQEVEALAIRFINAYLLQSMAEDRHEWLEESTKLRGKFETITHSDLAARSALKDRIVWSLAGATGRSPAVARCISALFKSVLKLKDSLK
ncbi:MAG TPA: glycosyltransferase [Bacteroidota bacterium]|nr:glycosyltransferase [Bacteroidota bacterium]